MATTLRSLGHKWEKEKLPLVKRFKLRSALEKKSKQLEKLRKLRYWRKNKEKYLAERRKN